MHDVIIIGGGPAGFSAAIYSTRYMMKTLVFSKGNGGAIAEAHLVENYPGIESISGIELSEKFKIHAKNLGAETINKDVVGIRKEENHFSVNNTHKAKKIIIAAGTSRKKLNIPGENDFIGKGVSYCATCDAPFYRNKTVAVVGGSNSAARAAELLADYADRVCLIYRGDQLRAEPVICRNIEQNPKIEIMLNSEIAEIKGEKFVSSAVLKSGEILMLDGVFIEIGSIPYTALPKELGIELDGEGYIKVDSGMRTNIPGVYAAGDITTGSNKWRQVVTACAEGGIAAASAYTDLKKEV